MLFSTDTSPLLIKALTNPRSESTDSLMEMGKFVKAVAITHGFSLPGQMQINFSSASKDDGTISTDVYICPVSKAFEDQIPCLLHIRIECNGFCTKVGLVSRMEEDGLETCMKLWTQSYFEQLY
jgi:hypothetical protein